MASVFSNRNIILVLFILVVLFLGAAFNVRLGPENFSNSDDTQYQYQDDDDDNNQ
jgi:predicted RND superfamily exporter protein